MLQVLESELIGYAHFKFIGKGSFSTIASAIHKETNREVAIKIFEKAGKHTAREYQNAQRESLLMTSFDHPFIIETFEVIESNKFFYIVMEIVKGGTLLDFIRSRSARLASDCKSGKNKSSSFQLTPEYEQTVNQIFIQMISAIKYLHDKKIVHRDLKLENFLLLESQIVKLIDFGFAKQMNYFSVIDNVDEMQSGHQTFCGSVSYAAPELFLRKQYTEKVDIWSLGVILYTMVCCKYPFCNESVSKTIDMIINNSYEPPSHGSPNLLDFLSHLLEKDPAKRYSVNDMISHPWISESPYYKYIIQKTAPNLNTSLISQNLFSHSVTQGQISSLYQVAANQVEELDFPTLVELKIGFEDDILDQLLSYLQQYKVIRVEDLHETANEDQLDYSKAVAYRIIRTEKIEKLAWRNEKRYDSINNPHGGNHESRVNLTQPLFMHKTDTASMVRLNRSISHAKSISCAPPQVFSLLKHKSRGKIQSKQQHLTNHTFANSPPNY